MLTWFKDAMSLEVPLVAMGKSTYYSCKVACLLVDCLLFSFMMFILYFLLGEFVGTNDKKTLKANVR